MARSHTTSDRPAFRSGSFVSTRMKVNHWRTSDGQSHPVTIIRPKLGVK